MFDRNLKAEWLNSAETRRFYVKLRTKSAAGKIINSSFHHMGSLNHLDLLREEHLKLQSKYEQLQQQYAFLQAKVDPGQSPDAGSLAGELFATMKNLFEQHTFRWVCLFS